MGNDYDFGKEKVHISSEVLTKTVNSYFTRNVHTHLTTNTWLKPVVTGDGRRINQVIYLILLVASRLRENGIQK